MIQKRILLTAFLSAVIAFAASADLFLFHGGHAGAIGTESTEGAPQGSHEANEGGSALHACAALVTLNTDVLLVGPVGPTLSVASATPPHSAAPLRRVPGRTASGLAPPA